MVRKEGNTFNVSKCHTLQVSARNQKFDYEVNGVKTERVQCAKDLGVTAPFKLKFSRQCKDAAGKTNRMLGFLNRNFSFNDKDIILPIHNSLFRPHLEYVVQFGRPAILIKDTAKLPRSCPVTGHEDDYIPV